MSNSSAATVLVVGASGATGRLLVQQLLDRGLNVKAIVRSPNGVPGIFTSQGRLAVIQGSVLDLSDADLAEHVAGCVAVASCLGHNLTFRGIYGPPHRLVTDTARRLCRAIQQNNPPQPVKYVLMNTTGNSNRDLQERISFGQKIVIGLLRLLLPPHVDNEKAADYLRVQVGQKDEAIQWVAVRPDNLIDETQVTGYDVVPSPTRSAIFDAGQTSRINVAHFMADLIADDEVWARWKGQMPVVYNQTSV
jgi:nucleoside-diphosphate-sugar epimerase